MCTHMDISLRMAALFPPILHSYFTHIPLILHQFSIVFHPYSSHTPPIFNPLADWAPTAPPCSPFGSKGLFGTDTFPCFLYIKLYRAQIFVWDRHLFGTDIPNFWKNVFKNLYFCFNWLVDIFISSPVTQGFQICAWI